jgi:hypothetical protein
MQQRDYIERLIQQIATFIARILGFANEGKVREAEEALDAAWNTLGVRRPDAMLLDDDSLRMLLGAKAPIAADLLDAQAAVDEVRGATASAQELRQRAAALRIAASAGTK